MYVCMYIIIYACCSITGTITRETRII